MVKRPLIGLFGGACEWRKELGILMRMLWVEKIEKGHDDSKKF